MLAPKREKFRKRQRGGPLRRGGERQQDLAFGDFGLIALEHKWITNRQIEAARVAMTRHVKRGGKVWVRIFPDMPYTMKPAETRMGKGKGNVEYHVAPVSRGTVMFELAGVESGLAREALTLAGSKLPIKTTICARGGLLGVQS